MKRKDLIPVLLTGAAHFLVDFVCTFLLTQRVLPAAGGRNTVVLCALLYNGFAFALQLPIGFIADRLRLTRLFSGAGCVIVAAAAFLRRPVALSVIAGLGNAFFHVGGGREALLRGEGKNTLPGIFVAPGAIGIFLGPAAARAAYPAEIFAALLALTGAALALTRRGTPQEYTGEAFIAPQKRPRRFTVAALLFVTVLLRSYMGAQLKYPFRSLAIPALLFVLCVFAGKLLGGVFADRFGALRFSSFAQVLCTVLFVVSVWVPYLGMPAVLLFNTSMAVTAAQLFRCFPRRPGAAFGLTTVALYLGVIPSLLHLPSPGVQVWSMLLLGAASAASLIAGLLFIGGDANGVRGGDLAGKIAGAHADF